MTFSHIATLLLCGGLVYSTAIGAEQNGGALKLAKHHVACTYTPETNTTLVDVLKHPTILLDQGWNHVTNTPPWQGLMRSPATYQFSALTPITSANCTGQLALQHSLLKKYVNWEQQHANGLLFASREANITFGNLKGLHLLFRINSTQSNVLSSAQLHQSFSDYLTSEQIDNFDDGRAYVELRLRHQDNWVASFNIPISLEEFDQWIYLNLAIDQLNVWHNQNYQRVPITLDELTSKHIDSVVLVAETQNRKVLRNFINPLPDIDEQFKEINLTLKHLWFDLK